jgi:hypothetical protein
MGTLGLEATMTFSTTTTTILFTLGAAVLAAWAIIRFPERGPRSLARSFVHLVIAFGLAALVPHGIGFVQGLELGNSVLVAALLVILPALLYMFLATLWLLRALQDTTGFRRF